MADKDELVSGWDISGNPPSLATLSSHRDTSPIAELLSNSPFITFLSEAVAKQISVSSNFASSSTGSLAGSTNETDRSKPSESSESVVNSGEASGSTKGSATKDKRAPEGDEPNASNNKKPRVQKPPLITIDGQDSNDLPTSVELEDELTTSGRWETSDELSALLPLLFTKELSAFERRAIVKDFPRPNVECVFAPNPDSYLGDLVPQAKPVDKPIKKSQDLILDVTGPLAMAWEHMNSAETLSVDVIQTCISKALFLLGNACSHLTTWRRRLVLDKLGSDYGSLAKESFPECKKDLFGPGLEEKVTKRAETAKVISSALRKPGHVSKKFFHARPSQNSKPSWEGHYSPRGNSFFRGRSSYNRTPWRGGRFHRRGSSRGTPNISGL